MPTYDYIIAASADLRAGRITQREYDRIVSRFEQYVVSDSAGYIVAVCGSALHDQAAERAAQIAGTVHHVCSYGHQYNCGGSIHPHYNWI